MAEGKSTSGRKPTDPARKRRSPNSSKSLPAAPSPAETHKARKKVYERLKKNRQLPGGTDWTPPPPNPVGRPTIKTPEFVRFILDTYESGDIPITVLCRTRDDFPKFSTIDEWCRADKDFAAEFQRAEIQFARNLCEDAEMVARAGFGDVLGKDRYGRPIVNNEVVARSKLRVGHRQWLASKMDRARYGDRTAHELSGPGGTPIDLNVRENLGSKLKALSKRLAPKEDE